MVQELLLLGLSNSLFHAGFPTQRIQELIIGHFRAKCISLRWRTYIFIGCIWRKELRNSVVTASKLSRWFVLSTVPVSGFHLSYWLRRNPNLCFLPLTFEGSPAYITLNLSPLTHCNTEAGGNKFLRHINYIVHLHLVQEFQKRIYINACSSV